MTSKETIRAAFLALPIHQRDILMKAVAINKTEVIMLERNSFIGVHVESLSNVDVQHKEGAWVLGRILQ